jgi:tetratricopeptide (TPR) repeat protein
MQKPADNKKIAIARAGPWAFRVPVVLFFFLLFFLYVWLRLEPALEYYSEGVVFSLSGSFLHRFLDYPGGLAEYGAAYLAQLNYLSWLGALVFTVLGVLLFLTTGWLCRLAVGRAPLLVSLAPSLVILAWRGQYEGHALAASLTLLLALGTALACHPVSRHPVWLRWPVSWAIGAALFYVAGLWPFLLFLFLVGWFEAIHSRKWLKVVVVGISGILIPVGWHVLQPLEQSLNPWGTGRVLYFALILFLLLPVELLVLAWFRQPLAPANIPAVHPRKQTGSKQRSRPAGGWKSVWGSPAFAIGSLLAGWVVVWSLFDGTQKKLAQIEYYAVFKQDKQLLAVAAQLKTMPPDAETRMRLALYHTGRLTEDLFAYADSGRVMLLPGLTRGMDTARAEIETLLELGQVSEAERMAQEALEFDGDRPDLLRELALINILKDRPEAAAIFLNALRQVPFQRTWATTCLAELEHNPRLTGHQELDLVRSRMPTTDFPHGSMMDAAETMLRQLLASNPRNQMAFEYLMAHYLLTGDLKRLAGQVGRLDNFAYATIPRRIEEALLLGQKLQGLQIELHRLKIQPDTVQRFQRFCDALGGTPGQTPANLSPLAPDFGDTFWFYYYSHLTEEPKSTD